MRVFVYGIIIASGFMWGCDRNEEAASTAAQDPQQAAAEAPTAGEAQPPAAQPAAPASNDVTCDAFISKMITLTASQGEDSFFRESSRAEWVAGCTQANDINQEPNVTKARCIIAANNLEEAQACGETRFVNRWMTLGSRGGGGGGGGGEGSEAP